MLDRLVSYPNLKKARQNAVSTIKSSYGLRNLILEHFTILLSAVIGSLGLNYIIL